MIVLSIINLEVKVCSIFDQFGLEAACNGGISAWSLSLILLMLQATKILWRQERKIISLKFNDEPFTLLGFWRGFKTPCVTCLGVSPVSSMVFYISVIHQCLVLGAHFICSTRIRLYSGVLLSFILAINFWISSCSEGYCHLCCWYGSCRLHIFVESLSKIFCNILLSSVGLTVWLSFPFIISFSGGFKHLIFFTASCILMLSFCMFSSSSIVF